VALGSSPKETAKAIAEGFLSLNVANLRKFGTSDQLRTMLTNLIIIERAVRNEPVADDDFDGTRKKHFRLGNIRKARLVIQGFAKSRRIPL
jgi:hypothetical protein